MRYKDLREFIAHLERMGELKRIALPVSPLLEMTEIGDRVLRAGGPALLFEHPSGYETPVLTNLFGTVRRVALAMGVDEVDPEANRQALRDIGRLLAALREPEPPKGFRDLVGKLPEFR